MILEKDTATALMSLATAMDKPINDMAALAETIEDDATRARLKKAIGDLMGSIYVDLMRPIELLYPDLNPDVKHRGQTFASHPAQPPAHSS